MICYISVKDVFSDVGIPAAVCSFIFSSSVIEPKDDTQNLALIHMFTLTVISLPQFILLLEHFWKVMQITIQVMIVQSKS